MQRHHHCELAFEEHLRRLRIPYVAVDEARKALLPARSAPGSNDSTLKSFDFLVSAPGQNLLVDIKGRRLRWTTKQTVGRLETWVTREDLRSMAHWQSLFGQGFEATFVFAYWTDTQPPDGAFEHLTQHRGRWYALLPIRLATYLEHAQIRSKKWETVDLPRHIMSESEGQARNLFGPARQPLCA